MASGVRPGLQKTARRSQEQLTSSRPSCPLKKNVNEPVHPSSFSQLISFLLQVFENFLYEISHEVHFHHVFPVTPPTEFLRGFWARGRVRGDRSVFVTSHRPVHAHFCSQPGSSFCISVQERYFLFDGSACLHLNTLIFKVLLLEFGQVFV